MPYFIGVTLNDAERVRKKLKQTKLLSSDFKVFKEGTYVFFPVCDQEKAKKILSESNIRFQVISRDTTRQVLRRKTTGRLKDILKGKIPDKIIEYVPSSFDIVGDICIVEIPDTLKDYKYVIAREILSHFKNIKAVFEKASAVSGITRIRKVIHLAGEKRTLTLHKENGCVFYVDISKVYFSPRLATEHLRVAQQVKDNEVVIDMFAGVGPFSILIAKLVKATVYAIDINPYAIELLKKNITINKLKGKVIPLLGDAKKIIDFQLKNVANRVIMNLPHSADSFIEDAFKALGPSGIIHFYTVLKGDVIDFSNKINFLESVAKQFNYKLIKIIEKRKVKEIAPHEYQVVIDAYFEMTHTNDNL
ncbi:MAG: class I SAM-dependent methyltransferase [Candidatus Asgardarchaeia archaeon]